MTNTVKDIPLMKEIEYFLDDQYGRSVEQATIIIERCKSEFESNGWISCEDRLPEDGVRVMFIESGTNHVIISYPHRRLWEEEGREHWAPIPEPPK